jgi:signal transduction histidine kinase
VAHELRTPLTILRLKVEQASGRIPQDLAEELHSTLHHLNHVVEQSLLIARAEQGRLAVQPQSFDLASLAEDVTTDFSMLAEEDGRRVCYKSLAPCWVRADPKHTRQIVHNLLSNALKHGCGDIEVSVTCNANRCELVISNPVATRPTVSEETRGLGLRVVETLLALQKDVTCDPSRTESKYRVGLTFPVVEALATKAR